jgi:hypothetical protein
LRSIFSLFGSVLQLVMFVSYMFLHHLSRPTSSPRVFHPPYSRS